MGNRCKKAGGNSMQMRRDITKWLFKGILWVTGAGFGAPFTEVFMRSYLRRDDDENEDVDGG